MKNSMVDIRNLLIAQLENLSDAGPEKLANEIERAKAMAQLGGVLIESAKTEIKFLESVDGAQPTGFLPTEVYNPPKLSRGI